MAQILTFQDTINFLVDVGVYNYFLPFLLIFSLVFAVLEKTQVLGENKSNINAVISIVIGLLLIVQQGIVEIINAFLPRVSLILIVILMGLVVLSLLAGKKFAGLQGTLFTWAAIISLVALFIALFMGPETGTGTLSLAEYEGIIAVSLPIIIFILAIIFVTRSPKTDQNKPSLGQRIDEVFSGGLK